MYKGLTCLDSSCMELCQCLGHTVFLIPSHNIWHQREEHLQPSKHLDQTSHMATSRVLCGRSLGNCRMCTNQKKSLVIYANNQTKAQAPLTPLTVYLQSRLAPVCHSQIRSATIPIPKCFQTFLVLHDFQPRSYQKTE